MYRMFWSFPWNVFLGKNYEKVCEMCHITLNKSAIFGDNGAISPGGVRIGEQFIAFTSRVRIVKYVLYDCFTHFCFSYGALCTLIVVEL